MFMLKHALALALFAIATTTAFAQKKKDPVPVKPPDEQTIDLIKHRTIKLEEALKALPAKTPEYMRSDVEIYHKAAEWIVRHGEWLHNDSGKWTLAILDQGLQRAADAAKGKAPWREPAGKTASFAYRSKVDGSVQPYAVTYPLDYGKDPKKKWRFDVVLHGRDSTICEVKFLYQHNGKAAAKDQDYVQLEVYGRGNNAYRWAGETDVFEAMVNLDIVESSFGRLPFTEPANMILRGFSMGGAGTWHIGLHHPSIWRVIGPGAGFTNTHGYVKSLPNPLPPYQEPLLHIYDALDYAENAHIVPIVAYSGEKDAQKAAADNIEKRLKDLKIERMTHLIGPNLEHQFPAEQQKRAHVEFVKHLSQERQKYPAEVKFTTYTLRYPRAEWITLIGLQKHYEKAQVHAIRDGTNINIKTTNFTRFQIKLPENGDASYKHIEIDGQKNDRSKYDIYYKDGGKWYSKSEFQQDNWDANLHKSNQLMGPIDDAFMTAFVCVKGTGTPWNDDMNKAADSQIQRFEMEWDKWMRGKLPSKYDKDVTDEDIRKKHLILFGDPSSNSLIAKTLEKIPITWNKEQLVVGGQKYESSKHLPMLIYPNPLDQNQKRYIVLNSGHTFHEADFKGTNALLYPRLGDYAVVRPLPTRADPAAFEVMKAGIFDDSWKISEK